MDDTTARRLAQNIRARRTALKLSQQRLAAEMVAAGCTDWKPTVVANVERLDKPRAVSVDELGALCVALRCSLEDLLGGMPEIAARIGGRSRQADSTEWAVGVAFAQRDQIRADLEDRLAYALQRQVADVRRIADDLYGRDVLTERDARMTDETPGAAVDRAKQLGHISRRIRDEFETYIRENDLTEDQW